MAMKTFAHLEVLREADLDVYCVNTLWARKPGNESVTSSTTFQDDNDLALQMAANSVYELTSLLSYDGDSTADLAVQYTGPAGFDISLCFNGLTLGAGSGSDTALSVIDNTADTVITGATGAANHWPLFITGTVHTAGTAGVLQLQWAQNASNGTPTRVLIDSWMCLRRID